MIAKLFSIFADLKPFTMDKEYIQFIADLKQNIVQSRYAAMRLANKEQLLLYFKTGKMLSEKVEHGKWGTNVIDRIAQDLQKQLPGLKGFSPRNLRSMRRFYDEYQSIVILQSPTAKLPRINVPPIFEYFWGISFTHHILILSKCESKEERFFYIEGCSTEFWSVSVLEHNIEAKLYKHLGKLPNNFNKTLPDHIKASALEVFRDEYLMDFISESHTEDERVFESKVLADIKNFILVMGKGFCFIGNQFRVDVGGEEFFIDLLFFNRHLQCLVAVELKRGKFKPEYAGQLNFYLSVLDEKLRLPEENASIGIVLCKEKNNAVVEFAIKDIHKGMGVATYRTLREVPDEMKDILPPADELARLL
jgi:predicted nuclease of restriction endonuclease-like (RecB) superfamily